MIVFPAKVKAVNGVSTGSVNQRNPALPGHKNAKAVINYGELWQNLSQPFFSIKISVLVGRISRTAA
jgi:hypothetical protein